MIERLFTRSHGRKNGKGFIASSGTAIV